MSPQHLDVKKCKQINVKSRNDAQRLPSHKKPWIRHCYIQLISFSYKFENSYFIEPKCQQHLIPHKLLFILFTKN